LFFAANLKNLHRMKRLVTLTAFCCIALSSIAQKQVVKPFSIGEIRTLKSAVLAEERTLNIYLPEGYKQGDTTQYPVIYLLDGSADEDFIHISGLVQFANFSWVDLIPKSIVVGIANIDRRRDYTFPTTVAEDKKDNPTSGSSKKFMDFVEKELQPFVDKTYKTSRSRMLIGQSLGGLMATEILYKKPELFTDYIIVSPSLWWDNESLLATSPAILKPRFTQPTTVYIAVGNEMDEMEKEADMLYKTLNDAHRPNLTLHVQHMEKENHATILHCAVYDAFEWLHGVRGKMEKK
jgi:predicted alpha/beta superfamily hydrolase